MIKKLNEEEASFNCSLNLLKNVVKSIFPEKINLIHNNDLKGHNDIGEFDFNDFQGFNSTNEDNKNQIESFQSSSKSLRRLYFINNNNNNNINSINKEEGKNGTLLNKKRNREKIFFSKKIANKNKFCKKYNFGRKSNKDKNIGKHNCFSKDNITIKIRTHFFHYIRDIIQKNSTNKEIKFIKFRTEFVANLKKDKNVDLLETKLIDILKNQPISKKNKKSKEFENRFIIDKIYEENKEKDVMKILELTFKELFIIFRRKLNKYEDVKELQKISEKIKGLNLLTRNDYDDIDYLKEDIRKQNSKNKKMTEKELEEYINKVSMACLDYEKWFYQKTGRENKRFNKINK